MPVIHQQMWWGIGHPGPSQPVILIQGPGRRGGQVIQGKRILAVFLLLIVVYHAAPGVLPGLKDRIPGPPAQIPAIPG